MELPNLTELLDLTKPPITYVSPLALFCIALLLLVYWNRQSDSLKVLNPILSTLSGLILVLSLPREVSFWLSILIFGIVVSVFIWVVRQTQKEGHIKKACLGVVIVAIYTLSNTWFFWNYTQNDMSNITIKAMLYTNEIDKLSPDEELTAKWEESVFKEFHDNWRISGGARVESIRVNPNVNERLEQLLANLTNLKGSDSGVDVFAIDVIWPTVSDDKVGDRGYAYAEDISQEFREEESQFFQAAFDNNKVKNTKGETRLIAVPQYIDIGLLFYRPSLLRAYNMKLVKAGLEVSDSNEILPPKTWEQLTKMAKIIQAGERAKGKNDFWGFVWQGKSYEGLTCNALEWLNSRDGSIIVTPNNFLDVDEVSASAAFKQAKGWIWNDGISPPSPAKALTRYDEYQTLQIWLKGNAAFMRHWSYVYRVSQEEGSKVQNDIGVTLLPKGSGEDENPRHASTLGGWQLMVNPNSKSKEKKVAINLVKFLTDPERQLSLATKAGKLPTLPALYETVQLREALPFIKPGMLMEYQGLSEILGDIGSPESPIVQRPSRQTGGRYPYISQVLSESITEILDKNIEDTQEVVRNLIDDLRRLLPVKSSLDS